MRGIDVSHYQGQIDWIAAARNGVDFAFIKATDGAVNTDPQFQSNWRAARSAGILCGAYHFLRPSDDAKAQGNHFSAIAALDDQALPPALDIEVAENVTPSLVEAAIIDWIGVVEKAFKVRPILYTSPTFWRERVSANFQSYPLWLACYDQEPEMPPFWHNWTFWQHSASGKVAGINSSVDLNVFYSDINDLKNLCIGKQSNVTG
ncbi:MAG: GH25 family lysozyme [Pseudomonadota bacterium]